MSRIEAARSLLFVPGNRPERFSKALAAGADAVVLDLEDSVPPEAKPSARDAIGAHWHELLATTTPIVVRINAGPAIDDLAWLASLPAPAAVMVPKAESGMGLRLVSDRLAGVALVPLIESAAGCLALNEMAGCDQVIRLALGHIDFMADTGLACSDDERELDPLRFAMTMASRVHGLAPPIDGVTASIDDDKRLREDTRRALRFGFGGKLCVHPRQVNGVHEALRPSAQDLQWAERVVAAAAEAHGAAVRLEGRMVDLPVVLQARRTLARAHR